MSKLSDWFWQSSANMQWMTVKLMWFPVHEYISQSNLHDKIFKRFNSQNLSKYFSKGGLTSSASAHKAQIVEAGHLVLHNTWSIPELSWIILIIPSHYCDHRPIRNLSQGHHLRREQWCNIFQRCVCAYARHSDQQLLQTVPVSSDYLIARFHANNCIYMHIYAGLMWKEN